MILEPRALTAALLLLVAMAPAPLTAATVPDAVAPSAAGAALMGPALRSTDLDRSIRFYTDGLGMTVARKIEFTSSGEVILSFGGSPQQPVILLYRDNAPGQSPAIEHGNGYGRSVLRTPDAPALFARLRAAGYAPDEIKINSVNHRKLFWVADPDGYRYEIVEASAASGK